jgi:hypothetical protein
MVGIWHGAHLALDGGDAPRDHLGRLARANADHLRVLT